MLDLAVVVADQVAARAPWVVAHGEKGGNTGVPRGVGWMQEGDTG